jgi:riboflavin kinase/FMN adenylyltransferase
MLQVYRALQDVPSRPRSLTIGNFDGGHIGHRRIFRRVVEIAKLRNLTPTVLTFEPHPARVLHPAKAPRMLGSFEDKLAVFRHEGIEDVVVIPFDVEFSKITPEQFARGVLKEVLSAEAVIVGENFRFGALQSGNMETLRVLGDQVGFSTDFIPSARLHNQVVSSSEVRRLITEGFVSRAGRLLEQPYLVHGDVVRGQGVGSKQTVPTLNLATTSEILPANGVYITRTFDEDTDRAWPSITNIGFRPTFAGKDLTVETFLLSQLDPTQTPERISVAFLRRVREERKFESPAELKTQILKDVRRAQAYFRRVAKWCGATPYNKRESHK